MGFEFRGENNVQKTKSAEQPRLTQEMLGEYQRKEAVMLSGIAPGEKLDGVKKERWKKIERALCLILMTITTAAAAEEAVAGVVSVENMPDKTVISGERNISGVVPADGTVPGAINGDGHTIYVDEKKEVVPDDSVLRKNRPNDFDVFQQGGSIEINGKHVKFKK